MRDADGVDVTQSLLKLQHGRSCSRVLMPGGLDELPYVVGYAVKTISRRWTNRSLTIHDLNADSEGAGTVVEWVTTGEQLSWSVNNMVAEGSV
jgi:hypothetical protein